MFPTDDVAATATEGEEDDRRDGISSADVVSLAEVSPDFVERRAWLTRFAFFLPDFDLP